MKGFVLLDVYSDFALSVLKRIFKLLRVVIDTPILSPFRRVSTVRALRTKLITSRLIDLSTLIPFKKIYKATSSDV